MKRSYSISIIALLLLLGYAFQFAPMDEWPANGKERFEEKTTFFKNTRMAKCRNQARSIAALMVDSVMTGKKILITVDTFERPFKPQKPEKPEFPFQVDTSAPDKLFQIDRINDHEELRNIEN